jgi:hypothetical protein
MHPAAVRGAAPVETVGALFILGDHMQYPRCTAAHIFHMSATGKDQRVCSWEHRLCAASLAQKRARALLGSMPPRHTGGRLWLPEGTAQFSPGGQATLEPRRTRARKDGGKTGLGDLDDRVDELLVEGVRRHQHHVQRRLLQRQRPRPARQRTSATGREGQRDGGSRVKGSKLGHRRAEAPRRRAARRHGASLKRNGRKAGGESG